VQVHPLTTQFGPLMMLVPGGRSTGETSGRMRCPPLQDEPSAQGKDKRADCHRPQNRGEDIRRVVDTVDDQCQSDEYGDDRSGNEGERTNATTTATTNTMCPLGNDPSTG
jgi:hypothetical protein